MSEIIQIIQKRRFHVQHIVFCRLNITCNQKKACLCLMVGNFRVSAHEIFLHFCQTQLSLRFIWKYSKFFKEEFVDVCIIDKIWPFNNIREKIPNNISILDLESYSIFVNIEISLKQDFLKLTMYRIKPKEFPDKHHGNTKTCSRFSVASQVMRRWESILSVT